MRISKIRMFSILFIILIGIITSYFYFKSHNAFGNIYQEETRNTIVEIKKIFIKNTIDNLIAEIDVERELEYERYMYFVNLRALSINLVSEDDDEYLKFVKNRFDADIKNLGKDNYWTVLFWDNITGEVVYDNQNEFNDDSNLIQVVEKLKSEFLSYKEVEHGKITGIFGVKTEFLNEKIKHITVEKIKRQKFDNSSYIKVNHLIDYEGGEQYAIRIVNPSMSETEGTFLSTSTTDIKGNKYNLVELEGIRKDGEVFFTYYCNKLNSDEIVENLTYSRLYKDFDWVIATGVYIDEIDNYVAITDIKSKSLSKKIIFRLMMMILGVMAAGIAIVIHTEGIDSKITNRKLKNEADYDALTNAFSRRRGVEELSKAYKAFNKDDEIIAIMMFDLDKFKQVNDNYGHDIGDIVLKKTVQTMRDIIRNNDIIIRWGGDEFVGIFYGLKKKSALEIAHKILEAVNEVEILVETSMGDEIVKVQMSIGVTCFFESDKQASDVVKRADDAMYESKETGRNKVIFYDVEV